MPSPTPTSSATTAIDAAAIEPPPPRSAEAGLPAGSAAEPAADPAAGLSAERIGRFVDFICNALRPALSLPLNSSGAPHRPPRKFSFGLSKKCVEGCGLRAATFFLPRHRPGAADGGFRANFGAADGGLLAALGRRKGSARALQGLCGGSAGALRGLFEGGTGPGRLSGRLGVGGFRRENRPIRRFYLRCGARRATFALEILLRAVPAAAGDATEV